MTDRLTEIRERLERATLEPTGFDDCAICANCHASVSVRYGCDWEDGDVCDCCYRELNEDLVPSVRYLLARLEAAERVVDAARYSCDLEYVGSGQIRCNGVHRNLKEALTAYDAFKGEK